MNAIPETAARIEWIDRETVAYVAAGDRVLVWLDYEPGFLSRGRQLRQGSIERWVDSNGEPRRNVTAVERELVVAAVLDYCKRSGTTCRLIE